MKGTPKTLIEAILNGLEESGSDSYNGVTAAYVEKHIHDYLNNCFLIIDDPELARVYHRIFEGSAFSREKTDV